MNNPLQPNNPNASNTNPALIRLEAVRERILAGKSFRQIARELDCDEKTVRRDYKKLLLPADKQQLIFSGAACEPILRKQESIAKEQERRRVVVEAAQSRQRQLIEEKQSGVVSNLIRDSIFAFLAMYNLFPVQNLEIINRAAKLCWDAGYLREDNRIADHHRAIALTMPGQAPGDRLFLDVLIEWLFKWLIRVEPNRDIRDRGIDLARQHFEPQSPLG
jgi:transposase-like protein